MLCCFRASRRCGRWLGGGGWAQGSYPAQEVPEVEVDEVEVVEEIRWCFGGRGRAFVLAGERHISLFGGKV